MVGLSHGHETLSVVVPWSRRQFQYTSKHTARPASGQVRIGTRVYEFGNDAWATLDHGRGRWPRAITWNRGTASGHTDGHRVVLQFGGKWTEGTGTTENALCVDGRLIRIDRELTWHYDPADFLRPWTIQKPDSDQVDVTFTPFHNHRAGIHLGVLDNRTNQCFGHCTGTIRTDSGRRIAVDGLLGWAEEVRMRW